MRSRKKTLLLSAALGIAVLAAGAAWVARGPLLERWWIYRLSSDDPEVRSTMVQRLGRSGGDAGARALAEGIADRETLGPDAVEALRDMSERLLPATRVWIARKLLLDTAGDLPVAKLLTEIGEQEPKTLEVFLETAQSADVKLTNASGDPESGLPAAMLSVWFLAKAWPEVRDRMDTWLDRAEPEQVLRFLQQLCSILDRDKWARSVHELFAGAEANVPGILDELARGHSRSLVRALALVLATSSEWEPKEEDTQRVKPARAPSGDPDLLVRMTALKVAGIYARGADRLDLKAALLREKDPRLLATTIEARTLAASPWSVDSLVVLPELVIDIQVNRDPSTMPFDAEEIQRLEKVLHESKDPALRDAASSALVVAAWLGSPGPNGDDDRPHQPRPGLEVREWSVWKERVRSSPAGPAGMATVQSAVFFRDAGQVTLDVGVALLGGVPDSFRPKVTNVGPRSGRVGSRTQAFLGHGVLPEEPPALDKAFWMLHDAARSPEGDADPHPIESDLHRVVPWAYNSEEANADRTDLRGFGLEWSGLRVGYGPDLEGEVAPLPEDRIPACWVRAREVKCTPIALRGGHERFLFFDGSSLAPSPVVIEWADRRKHALVLRTRDFLCLPHRDDWQHYGDDSLLRRGEHIVPGTANVPAVFVVRKEPGQAPRGACLRNLPSRSQTATVALDRLHLEGAALETEIRKAIEGQGWVHEDGKGLLSAWVDELLQADGTRVLTILPRWLHEAVLPLEITPAPQKTTRVGIVWNDCEGLALRGAVPENPAGPFAPAEPLEIETSSVETRREPLQPGPATPFEIREDGLLFGIWPGENSMLFAEDGRFIVHPKDGLTGVEIYVGDLETRQFRMQVRLPRPLIPEDYTFSADGSRIGMLVLDGAGYRVLIADVRAGTLIEIVKGFGSLAWSHSSRDGRVLSFLEDGEPRLFDLETNEIRRVRLPGGAKAHYPMLTPDGRKMALILETTTETGESNEIALLDLATNSFRRLANVSGRHCFPSLSADGSKVLFIREEEQGSWLYVADLEGHRLLRISPHIPTMHCRGLTNDGSTVFFTNETGIWATDLRTGASRLAYAPRGFKIRDGGVSSNGKKALVLGAHPETDRVLGVYHLDLEQE